MRFRLPFRSSLCVLLIAASTYADEFREQVQPLLGKYCVECHAGDDPSGDIDFRGIDSIAKATDAFELWGKVSSLLKEHRMPPEDAPQPTAAERQLYHAWYQRTFVETVEAKPGPFRPRRLSATEYRNTLRSLFGFDLEVAVMQAEQTISEKSLVMKLLPTDPPGKSRFRNDTHSNPLSTQILETYSYLTDFALEELFSAQRRERLSALSGELSRDGFSIENAETLMRYFVPRAWRRDVSEAELQQSVNAVRESTDIVAATKRELKRVLMAPQFLYRGLLMPREAEGRQAVDDFELAERLSYFIWGDMPDEELLRLARAGELSGVLDEQVERMLDSPRGENLATDFAVQWLSLDEIEHVSDNPPYMVALKSQPVDFVRYLIGENRPLLELIDSKTTFANPLTRRFYGPDSDALGSYRKPKGIEIEIVPNAKLTLNKTTGRGGLLTMPGVLAMNRGPILRGVWMLERVMGDYLPDPPANVGQVAANIPGENLTFRERFEQHRENETCAICHDKIDPLGFALEAYDDKGGYLAAPNSKRNAKRAKKVAVDFDSIDTSGRLPGGEEFADFAELKQILMTTQREPIVRNIVKQMLAYALCRKLEMHDQPTVETIVGELLTTNGTWRDLVHAIANSLPFREYDEHSVADVDEGNSTAKRANHDLED